MVEMTLSASKRVGRRLLGLICIFSPGSCLTRGGFGPFVGQPFDFGSSGTSPRAPWGLIGVGHVSRVTPSSVSATKGAELMTLASTARVSRSMSSLTGMFMWNPGPSFAEGVGKALMWHSTTS